jgi:FlaA1/EpsC-like NDP-sugar epimerase
MGTGINMNSFFNGKTVLITGGTGTLGRELTQRLLPYEPKEIRIFSRGENGQAKMKESFPTLTYILGDISSRELVERSTAGVDIIFHLAAMKYADIAETNPYQTVLSNVIGSMNVMDSAMKYGVKLVVCSSTDKATNPRNLYGMTKRMMEYLFLEPRDEIKTKFLVVRFGNIFGSTGSVVERWCREAAAGKELSVTDPKMTRYYCNPSDAVDLIFTAIEDGDHKAIYSMAMDYLSVGDLADVMQTNGTKIIGNRGNEKDREVLASEEEKERSEYINSSFSTIPVFKINKTINEDIYSRYPNSYSNMMTKPKIREMVIKYLVSKGLPICNTQKD